MTQNEQKVSFRKRWNEAQPSKTMLFWSVIGAMVLTLIVGFNWGGWVTGGTAQSMAETAAKNAVVERLALICVDQFHQDPGKAQKLVEFNDASSYQKDDYVRDQGWATISGAEKPDTKVADACAKLIAQLEQ